jgi:hypothetical protein
MDAACSPLKRRKQSVECRDRPAADQRQGPGRSLFGVDQIRRNLDRIGMRGETQERPVDVRAQSDFPRRQFHLPNSPEPPW